jgi:eukaryotic-like serine/threonine-protein kinase
MSGCGVQSRNGFERESSADGTLARTLEAYLASVESGGAMDPDGLVAQNPAIADELRSCLEILRLAGRVEGARPVGGATAAGEDPSPARMLGDFRILRQVGRGGMGIVYEAEQVSLHRRVALKVLPFAASLDPEQSRRFQTEARAVAQLHHTNIVPVFSVGSEGGVHYYAMQFIEGQTLAALIQDLRRLSGRKTTGIARLTAGISLAEDVVSGRLAPSQWNREDGIGRRERGKDLDRSRIRSIGVRPRPGSESAREGEARRPRQYPIPTPDPTRSRSYFRTVAYLGVQAAEALEHAHAMGVVHRDIKPDNLLVDVRGNLWVTDFGLARVQSDTGLTTTGNVVGTLRYMSPEQALSRRTSVDQRTDIYSMGATLYELLALRSAFTGRDREELLQQVTLEEPVPPRRLNPAVPADLETIVLKAMAKESRERYSTARELADDLRRFLDLKPIKARSPTLWDRTLKWSRRHVAIMAAAFLVLLLAVGGLATGLVLIRRQRDLVTAKQKEATASANEARQRAIDMEWQLYINRVNRSHGEWRENNIALAETLLKECPPALRGWEWSYCWRLCHLERLTLRGHGQPIHSLAFGPDGRWLITAAKDPDRDSAGPGQWSLWDAATGREIQTRPTRGTWMVAVDPSGTTVALGSRASALVPGTVTLWKTKTQDPPRLEEEPAHILRTRLGTPRALAFSPDGRRIATVSCDPGSCLEIWDVGSGRQVLAVDAACSRVFAVAFRPDGKQLATACDDRSVKLWDAATGAAVGRLAGHTSNVYDVTYSPDGRLLVSCGQDETVRVWDAGSGRPIHLLRGHDSFVRAVAVDADATRIASASEDNAVQLWDAVTGQEIGKLRGHARFVTDVAFSPDGRSIASTSEDGTVKIWDAKSAIPTRVLTHPGWIATVAYFPDALTIATVCRQGVIQLWDSESARQVRVLPGNSHDTSSLSISPDGRRIATASPSGTVYLWDAATARMIRALIGHEGRSNSVAFHPDGRQLATAGRDGTARIWDTETGELVRVFRVPGGIAISTACSPDGTRIAAAFSDETVRVWDLGDGHEVLRLNCETFEGLATLAANILAFSPDGRQLAACRNIADRTAGEVLVFDAATGRLLLTLRGHTSNVTSVAFSPDGRRIATSSFDRTAKLWETGTGQEVFTLRGHTSGVLSVAFSPDGQALVTGSIDCTTRIWDSRLNPERTSRQPADGPPEWGPFAQTKHTPDRR